MTVKNDRAAVIRFRYGYSVTSRQRVETRSLPALAHVLPPNFYVDHSHSRARASYLAALPSTRANPDRDVFYVADPISSIQLRVRLSSSSVRRVSYESHMGDLPSGSTHSGC